MFEKGRGVERERTTEVGVKKKKPAEIFENLGGLF